MTSSSEQYRIIQEGAGWRDERARGRLRFDGRDAVTFLHALVTQDIASLTSGHSAYTTYLTPQGRMVADLWIHHRGDHLLVVVPAGQAQSLAARFDSLIFSEDVRVSDASDSVGHIAVAGGRAEELVRTVAGAEVFVARTDRVSLPTVDVFMPALRCEGDVRALEAAGAVPISDDLMTALRIEAGHPEFGIDMSDETIPLEAGLLDRAISTTKGCYVGQEVIVRVLHRGGGRVAKRLVRLNAGESALTPGVVIRTDGREVGRVTSAAWSPARNAWLALGYLQREVAEAGGPVSVVTESGERPAGLEGLAG